MTSRKLSFQEVWASTTVFFVDDTLEDEIDRLVDGLLRSSPSFRTGVSPATINAEFISFLTGYEKGLEIILRDVGFSDEKFMRIVSLLRRIGRVPGDFESEWTISKIKRQMRSDENFATIISDLLLRGKSDTTLASLVPRYYLEKLNYEEISQSTPEVRRMRYKDAFIGTYGAKKGHRVEGLIRRVLEDVRAKYGIGFEKGRSRFVNVDIDFAIPSLQDPWIILMSSFQETTSSGQTTKARDMLAAYTQLTESNSRYREKRIFINFVDGGGWLARRSDLQRLVRECDYILNLQNLKMLDDIILRHIPRNYFR
jgi:hypothetical protein